MSKMVNICSKTSTFLLQPIKYGKSWTSGNTAKQGYFLFYQLPAGGRCFKFEHTKTYTIVIISAGKGLPVV